ncbi:MAG: thioether cross-link-forming SCIFF peptide maturase [Clostridiales bacterium]|nr:thioether cross-link-forming SCIFF peptide maturase [Clostridiales bacterium]
MIHKFNQGGLYIVLDVNSGAIHVIDEMVYDILDYYPNVNPQEVTSKLKDKYLEQNILEAIEDVDSLIAEGFLFSPDKYENNIHFKSRKPVLKSMCLHVAHDCNLRCGYCFASQGDFQGTRSLMSAEVGKKALLYLAQNSENRYNLEVDFFGGEPLMNFEVVKEVAEYGKNIEKLYNKNFRYTITTNGMLLTDEITDYINEHMDNVVMSLDGTKETNDKMRPRVGGGGSYDIIVPKFQNLVSKRGDKDYFIRGTFTKLNLDFAKDIKHFAELGFKSTSMEPVVSEPGLPYTIDESDLPIINKQYDDLAEEMLSRHGSKEDFGFFHFNIDLEQGPCIIKRLSGCGAGSEYIAVTPEGDIYPCHQFVGQEEMKMGSILDKSWDNEMSTMFKNAHVYNKPSCKSCWARFYCSGGCHANAYNFNGDINVPYEIGCKLEKKRLETSIYMQAKIMLMEGNDD